MEPIVSRWSINQPNDGKAKKFWKRIFQDERKGEGRGSAEGCQEVDMRGTRDFGERQGQVE